jgi:hypothetical protein
MSFRTRLGPALGTALLSAAVATALLLIPFGGLLLSFLFMPVVLGPPIVAQVIALEDASLRRALERTRRLLRGRSLRMTQYLLNVGVGLGIVAVVIVGGAMYAVLLSPELVRVLIGSVYQSIVLGAFVGYLSTVEYVIYTDLSATARDPIPD